MELTEEQLLEMAQAADAGGLDQTSSEPSEAALDEPASMEPAAAEPPDSEPTSAEEEEKENELTNNEPEPTSSEPRAENKEPAQGSEEERESDLSPYERQKRKAAREWERINRSKEDLAAREQQIAEREAKLKQDDDTATSAASAKPAGIFAAEEFEHAAREFEKRHDPDNAELCRNQARRLRERAEAEEVQWQQQDFVSSWQRDIYDMCDRLPELQDPESSLGTEVQQLLNAEPILSQVPGGFKKAVEIAQLRLSAARVPELEGQLHKLKAELDRLNKATALGGSNPALPPLSRTLDQMTEAEADAHFHQLAAEHDRALFGVS